MTDQHDFLGLVPIFYVLGVENNNSRCAKPGNLNHGLQVRLMLS